LPLWFEDRADYSRLDSGDILETVGLADLLRGRTGNTMKVQVSKRNGDVLWVPVKHSMSSGQLKWLREGSALNYIRSQMT
jgi:homoaconitase